MTAPKAGVKGQLVELIEGYFFLCIVATYFSPTCSFRIVEPNPDTTHLSTILSFDNIITYFQSESQILWHVFTKCKSSIPEFPIFDDALVASANSYSLLFLQQSTFNESNVFEFRRR
ncbi:MAG: hypothetical protein ACRECH_15800 [Nitrososphaerales archaeon]